MKNYFAFFIVVLIFDIAVCASVVSAQSAGSGVIQDYAGKDITGENAEKADIAYNLGMKYYRANAYEHAVDWFQKAAELGSVKAQSRLGTAYELGEGTAEDYVMAFKWYSLAAAQNDSNAQFGLGKLYAAGHGVTHDDVKAVGWYRMAAEQGVALAQYALGKHYFSGRGVKQDYQEAYFWLGLVAKDIEDAMEKRDEAGDHLTDGELEEVWHRLDQWTPVE